MVFHYIISLFKTCSDIHTCHRIHHMKPSSAFEYKDIPIVHTLKQFLNLSCFPVIHIHARNILFLLTDLYVDEMLLSDEEYLNSSSEDLEKRCESWKRQESYDLIFKELRTNAIYVSVRFI